MKNNNKRGVTIAVAGVLAGVLALLIFSVERTIKFTTYGAVYMHQMDEVFRLAETGLNEALGALATDPSQFDPGGTLDGTVINFNGGTYQNFVTLSLAASTIGGFYIVTVASKTVGSKTYSARLHTHAIVSNAAEYFWAVNGELILAAGTDAGAGKIYAVQLRFMTQPGKVTKAKSAEYAISIDPLCQNDPGPCDPAYLESPKLVEITEPSFGPNVGRPIDLAASIVFPQVLDTDIAKYKDIAHIGGTTHMHIGNDKEHAKCDFRVDPNTDNEIHIYPPGYEFGRRADDDYMPVTQHTGSVMDHVYFCDGDAYIGASTPTYVHGQVLVVATGTIYITGNIIRFNDFDDPATLPDHPSITIGSSTAHQLILITPGNVVITNDYHPGDGFQRIQTIHAVILAPYGRMSAEPYFTDYTIHNRLALRFVGSMILNEIENYPDENFGTVFQGTAPPDTLPSRTYNYMESLSKKPPPYMPALSEIHFSLEETTSGSGVF